MPQCGGFGKKCLRGFCRMTLLARRRTMSERDEYRELLDRARQLSNMPIDAIESQKAIAAIRQRIGGSGNSHWKTPRRKTLLIMSGSLAAAIALIIAMFAVTTVQPRKVDAAEDLQTAADATKGYKGWVHVKPVAESGGILSAIKSALKPHVETIHINTVDGSFAVVANLFGTHLVVMGSPVTHELRMFTSISGTILISTVEPDDSTVAAKQRAAFPLKLADILGQMKSRGVAPPHVAESADQGLQRFDLTLADDSKKTLDQYPEMFAGKLTLWVDPKTNLIRKMTGQIDDQPTVLEYTYGPPDIHDIYDLGVPKTAKIVDNRQTAANGKRPPVFDLPPIALLVKDESIDIKTLKARLQKRNESDVAGDFVSLECNESKGQEQQRQGQLAIRARQRNMELSTDYLLAPEAVLFGGSGFPRGWPTPKLSDVVSLLKSVRPQGIDVFDGKNAWHGESGQIINSSQAKPTTRNDAAIQVKSVRPEGIEVFDSGQIINSSQAKPTTRNDAAIQVKISVRNFWPSLQGMSPITKIEVLRDPARPGLVVLHVGPTIPSRVNNGTSDYQYDAKYWLDPAHDDLPVESVIHYTLTGGETRDTAVHFVNLNFARLADGRWYPSHWQYGTIRSPATRPAGNDAPVNNEGYVEYWRQIIQDEKLGPEWYGDPNLRFIGAAFRLPTTDPVTTQP
jgi:hypothetical protein